MRAHSLAALALGLAVLIWQIPSIGSEPTRLWLSLAALAVAVILLAIVQVRRRG